LFVVLLLTIGVSVHCLLCAVVAHVSAIFGHLLLCLLRLSHVILFPRSY